MRRTITLSIAALALAVPFTGAFPARAADKTIVVTASATDFTFKPSTVTLQKGVPVTVLFKSESGAHGLDVPALGINKLIIASPAGTPVQITPKKAGTYDGHCTLVCGAGHDKMAMQFIVK